MAGMDWVVSEAGEPLDTLEILGITAHGYHGVLKAERTVGQQFVVDLKLHLDTAPAAAEDRLDLSVDYATVAQRVVEIIGGEPVFLIETLAQKIANAILGLAHIEAAEIAVHKPGAPLTVHASDVIVRIHRRSEFGKARPRAAQPPDEAVPGYPRRPPAPRPGPGDDYAVLGAPMLPDAAEFGPAGIDVSGPLPDRPSSGPLPIAQAPPAGPTVNVAALLTARGLPLTRRNIAAMEAELADAGRVHGEAPLGMPLGTPIPPLASLEDSAIAGGTEDPARSPARDLDSPPEWPTDAILSLGANLGDSVGTLRQAIDSLRSVPGIEVIGISPLARTKPVGFAEQPDFFNAIVAVRTTLSPRALLYTVQGIEEQFGRDRSRPGGPRTLDIDIVAFDTLLDGDEELDIPHPRAHERAFVLLPWATLSPDAFLPGLDGGAVALLAERAPDRGGVHWLALDWLTLPIAMTGALPKPPPAAPDLPWAV
jgi:dihydroneopterin aldolase/2-amino-4-hydroxy-6-hydroxymethyldihydropteridine diphosphokinase